MDIQPQFKESRASVLQDLICRHPLATFVIHSNELVVNHFPLVFDEAGEQGVLKGHVPRSNSLWKALEGGLQAVAIFQGPQAYITPSWYPSKHEHGKAVPTWNYAVVHAHGRASAVHDADWLTEHLNLLTHQQEASQKLPWKVADAPAEFTAKMIEQLVGIEMPIASITGKWKVSQNRSHADQLGVSAGLRSRGSSVDLAMEALVADRGRS